MYVSDNHWLISWAKCKEKRVVDYIYCAIIFIDSDTLDSCDKWQCNDMDKMLALYWSHYNCTVEQGDWDTIENMMAGVIGAYALNYPSCLSIIHTPPFSHISLKPLLLPPSSLPLFRYPLLSPLCHHSTLSWHAEDLADPCGEMKSIKWGQATVWECEWSWSADNLSTSVHCPVSTLINDCHLLPTTILTSNCTDAVVTTLFPLSLQ